MIRRIVRSLRGSVLTLALVASNVSSFAVAPPPRMPFESDLLKSTMKEPPSIGLQMGSLHLLLEKTTLDDVRQEDASGEIGLRSTQPSLNTPDQRKQSPRPGTRPTAPPRS